MTGLQRHRLSVGIPNPLHANYPLAGGIRSVLATTGLATLRLRYITDATSSGRGVYIDYVRIRGQQGALFDDTRPEVARGPHPGAGL
ncbi:MAG: hypothetical protein H0U04_12230 [Rubrobacter sp.]|nr:hypothetical protein [Rubrobacter sp.]